MISGLEYFVIESTTLIESLAFRSRVFMRQDRTALYSHFDEGGISAVARMGAKVPAPRRSEIVLLAYPVHVGSTWKAAPPGSQQTEATFTIEAFEPIHTPWGVESAARVRARDFISYQPDLSWYGRSGVLRTWKRTESPFTTPHGEHGMREQITEDNLVSAEGL